MRSMGCTKQSHDRQKSTRLIKDNVGGPAGPRNATNGGQQQVQAIDPPKDAAMSSNARRNVWAQAA